MQSRSIASTSLLELLHHRAELLAGPPSDELTAVTRVLIGRLSAEPPRVRRVSGNEPAALLARLLASEPVHPFDPDAPDEDLADRLADDRRCYVLEHPSLPGHPMNVVWVALWRGVAGRIAEILDPSAPTLDPLTADTAVFYSIWNVEPGLVGIPGGTSLLSGAIAEMQTEFPEVGEFVTLSPIPGFRRWWLRHGEREIGLDSEPSDQEAPELLSACADYLCTFDEGGRLLDPVARFHLGNGARLTRLNWLGDPSGRGLARSFGLMANYHYQPEDRLANRAALSERHPAVSHAIRELRDARLPE